MQRIAGKALRRSPHAGASCRVRAQCTEKGKTFSANDVDVGHVFEKQATFDASNVQTFLEVSGDSNPIHTCASAARARGFQACIVPGMLCASLFPAIIGTAFPGSVYMMQDLKFRHPCLVGESVLARVTLMSSSGTRLKFKTECLGPKTNVLIDGAAVALMPS